MRRGCSREPSADEAFPRRMHSVVHHHVHLVADGAVRLVLLVRHPVGGKPLAWVVVDHLVRVAVVVVAALLSRLLPKPSATMWARPVATNVLLYRELQMPLLNFLLVRILGIFELRSYLFWSRYIYRRVQSAVSAKVIRRMCVVFVKPRCCSSTRMENMKKN